MSRWLGAVALAAAMVASGGCPASGEGETPLSPLRHWDFDMGSRGGGTVHYNARGGSGPQSGDCLLPVCHTRIEHATSLELTALPASGYRFRYWEGDAALKRYCVNELTNAIISIVVDSDRACFAVFEATGSGGPTAPGLR